MTRGLCTVWYAINCNQFQRKPELPVDSVTVLVLPVDLSGVSLC